MMLEVTLNIHIDPERWAFIVGLDSEDETPVAEDVIEFLKDLLGTGFDAQDQQGLIDTDYKIL